jgi:putative (di)nucleoside polyphosphate hydrolase
MYRKGVSALIQNKNKEFLLVNLQSFKAHFFAIPGGGVESGESLEDAIFREVFEELGIVKEKLRLVGKSDLPVRFNFKGKKLMRNGLIYDGQDRFYFGFEFLGSDEEINLQMEEIRAYIWSSYEDLKEYLLFDDQLEHTQKKILEIFAN